MTLKNKICISETELELLELINKLGPCSTDKVHEALDRKPEYLLTMRNMHMLVENGFLQRVIINKKLLYRTPRKYRRIRAFFSHLDVI